MKYIENLKRNRKRILSAFLCAAMVFTSVNTTPVHHLYADEQETQAETSTEEELVTEETTEETTDSESSEESTEETAETAESSDEAVTEETTESESDTEEMTESELATEETSESESEPGENLIAAFALGAVNFMNNGYPYGKSATRTDITLVAEVADASRAGTVQWQYASGKDGVYQDISGANSLTYVVNEPRDGYWYRCVVNGKSVTKPVMLIKSGDTAMKSIADMTRENFNGYWYVSNGVMCYTSIDTQSGNVNTFDVMGLYNRNGKLYWMNTSFSRGWQVYSGANATPGAIKASDWGYSWSEIDGAKLDALRFSFNSNNEHIVEMEADLAAGEQSFAVGADVMLSDYSVTSYCDSAALKTVFDDNDIIKQIQMVGAAKTEDAVESDPALVLKFDSIPAYYWVGSFYDRLAFSQNLRSSIQSYYDSYYTFSGTSDSDYAIECQGLDSGLVASYTNIPSGGTIRFSFGVGNVAQAGAQISINCGVQTNGESTDETGGTVEIEGMTITAQPSNKYSVFDGWYTEDGEKITSENASFYGIDSVDDNQLVLNPATKSLNVVAKFNQNYIVVYNMDGVAGLPDGTNEGIDEGADNTGYAAGIGYEVLSPLVEDDRENKRVFAGWNTSEDGSGVTYLPGEIFSISGNTELYAQWKAYSVLLYDMNDNGKGTGIMPESFSAPAGTVTTTAEIPDYTRPGYTFIGWSRNPVKTVETDYVAGQELILEGDTVLYAVWKLNAPGMVEAVSLDNIGVTEMTVNYNTDAVGDNATGYVIQVSKDGTFEDGVYQDIEIDNAAIMSYTLTGLDSGTYYYVRITAYTDDGYQKVYSGNTTNIDKAAFSNVLKDKTEVKVTVSSEQKVQVNLAVGSTSVDYSTFEQDLKKRLIEGGISEDNILISAVSSSSAASTNSFTWNKYDHTNGSTSTGTNKHFINVNALAAQTDNAYNSNVNHIVESNNGATLDFYGYGSSAYKDFYLYANEQTTRKEVEFDITEGEAYDAFDGAGFLVNASVTGKYSASYSNAEKLNGYLVYFQYGSNGKGSSIKIFELTNINTYAMQQGFDESFNFDKITGVGQSYSPSNYGTIKLIAQANTGYGDYKYRKVHIKVLPTYIQMWYSEGSSTAAQKIDMTENNASRDNYIVKWNADGQGNGVNKVNITAKFDSGVFRGGFGPIASYRPHGCEKLTRFTMSNVSLDMDVVKSLTETIRNPEWRDDYYSYLVNLDESQVKDFSDEYSTAEIINRLIEENVTYIGWCGVYNAEDSKQFIEKTGTGCIVNSSASATSTYDKQIKAIADYILSNVKFMEGKQSTVSNAENLSRYTVLADDDWHINGLDGTSLKDGGWTITKSKLGFDTLNSDGSVSAASDKDVLEAGNLSEKLLINEGTGYYQVYRNNECYNSDGSLNDNARVYLQIRINREPVSGFTVTTDGMKAQIISNADDDAPGFTDEFVVKKVSDNSNVKVTDGEFSYEYDTVYIIRQIVTDSDGAVSTYMQQFSVKQNACTVPYGSFILDKTSLMINRDTELVVTDNSMSSDGSEVTATYYVKNSKGTTVATFTINAGEQKNLDISGYAEGSYTVSMTAKASRSGKKDSAQSESVTRTFVIGDGVKVSYDLNGSTVNGNTELEVSYVPVGDSFTLPSAKPYKAGLTFAGWQLNDGTGKYYKAGNSIAVPDVNELVITAVFKEMMNLEIENSFRYYVVNEDGSYSYDAASEDSYPSVDKVRLLWRKSGESAWKQYDGSITAYRDSFTIAAGGIIIGGLEITADDNVTVYEYKLEADGISQYDIEVSGDGNVSGDGSAIKADVNKAVKISNVYNPEKFDSSVSIDISKIPSWYSGIESTKLDVYLQFYSNADKEWKEIPYLAKHFVLTVENSHSEPVSLWKYEGITGKGMFYRMRFASFAIADREYANEDGTVKLPNILSITYLNMKYVDNTEPKLTAKITFNQTYVDYDEDSNTLKFKKDITLDEPLAVDGDVTIDLNGHIITGPKGGNTIEVVGSDSSLKVTDSSTGGKKGQIRGGQGTDGETGGNGGNGIYAPSSNGSNINIDDGIKVSGGKGGVGADGKRGEPGKTSVTIDSAKNDALRDVENNANDAKKQIDAMDGLTDEEKEEAKKKIDEAMNKAKDEISNADNLEDIESKKDAGAGELENTKKDTEKSNGSVVEDAKNTAKNEMAAKVDKAKEDINNLDNLTPEQKQEAKKNLDSILEKTNEQIDASESLEDIGKELDRGGKKLDNSGIENEKLAQKNLEKAKEDAKDELDRKADEAKKAIDELPNLSADEKQAAKDAIDDAVEEAKKKLEEYDKVADIAEEKENAADNINQKKSESEDVDSKHADDKKRAEEEYEKTAKEFAEKVDNAKGEVSGKKNESSNIIDSLDGLTDDEKNRFKSKLNDILNEGLNKISEADTTDSVNAAKNELESKINEVMAEAESLNNDRIKDSDKNNKAEAGDSTTSETDIKENGNTASDVKESENKNPDNSKDSIKEIKNAADEIKTVISESKAVTDEKMPADAEIVIGNNSISYEELVEFVKNTEVKPDSILAELGVSPEEMAALLVNEDVADTCLKESVNAGVITAAFDNRSELIVSGNFTDVEHVLATTVLPQELIGVMSGEQLEIRLVIQQEEELKTYDKLAESVDSDSSIGSKMQVNLYKIKNNTDWENIVEVSDKIRFAMAISEDLVADGRVFELLLSHELDDGSVVIIRCEDLDDIADTITCETDRFCDALLIYRDVKDDVKTDDNHVGEASDVTDDGSDVEGESSRFILFNLLALLVLLGATASEWAGRRKEKYIITAMSVIALIVYIVRFSVGAVKLFDLSSIFYALMLAASVVCMIIFGKIQKQDDK